MSEGGRGGGFFIAPPEVCEDVQAAEASGRRGMLSTSRKVQCQLGREGKGQARMLSTSHEVRCQLRMPQRRPPAKKTGFPCLLDYVRHALRMDGLMMLHLPFAQETPVRRSLAAGGGSAGATPQQQLRSSHNAVHMFVVADPGSPAAADPNAAAGGEMPPEIAELVASWRGLA